VNSDIKISTTVPAGATTGLLHVTTGGGTGNSSTTFTVTTSTLPTISSFSPTSGPVGTPVVINGTGFTGASNVTFHGTSQSVFTINSDIKISTTVPSGASGVGPITVTAPGGTATSSTNFTVTTTTSPPHVMVVVMENEEYSSIIGSSNAPYINSLATAYRSATNWFAVQGNSPHDYLDLLVGSDLGLPSGVPYSATTLVDELHSAGVPWKGYMESMPSSCDTGGSTTDGKYDPIHNPFHYFTNYTTASGGWCSSGNASTEGVLPYPTGGLVSTLDGANAPDFVWVTPNNCDNMHGTKAPAPPCPHNTGGPLIKAGDTWLSSNLGPVISSSWFSNNGIIILTWDEGTSTKGCCGLSAPGGHIATIVIASNNKGGGKFTPNGDHFGTLRGIQESYAVTPLLGGAAKIANGDLRTAF
jgi:Phosphoesterase family/IPT/TIG domain